MAGLSFAEGLDLLRSGRFSDLEVSCTTVEGENIVFPLHRNIICSKSTVISGLCDHKLHGTSLPVRIELPHIKASAFAKTVEGIYLKKFDTRTPPLYPEQGLLPRNVNPGADVLSQPELEEKATAKLFTHSDSKEETVAEQPPPGVPPTTLTSNSTASTTAKSRYTEDVPAGLRLAIDVYLCAKELGVSHMVSNAQSRAIKLMETIFLLPTGLTGMAASLNTLFEHTESGKDPLRDEVVGLCVDRHRLCSVNSAMADLLGNHEPVAWKVCVPKLRQAHSERDAANWRNSPQTTSVDKFFFPHQPATIPASTLTPFKFSTPDSSTSAAPRASPFNFGSETPTSAAAATTPFLFGNTKAAIASSSAPSSSLSAAPSSAIAPLPNSTSLFGQPAKPSTTASPSSGSFTFTPFNAAQSPPTMPSPKVVPPYLGTFAPLFDPVVEKERNGTTNTFLSITMMTEYSQWSVEELRLADYAYGRCYGSTSGTPAFGQLTSSGFGMSNTSRRYGAGGSGGGLFGSKASASGAGGSSLFG